MSELWRLMTLALLGAYHGINPAMGWLFAVALGLQERTRQAVFEALLPIALGHALAIGLTLVMVGVLQLLLAPWHLRLLCAGGLIGFGVYKMVKGGTHPGWVGMRVGFRDLTVWSLLMSTAHGAGLMLVPILLRSPAGVDPAPGHPAHAEAAGRGVLSLFGSLLAVGVHTAAMFLVMGVIAVVVFEKVGLAILRRAWFNVDYVWAVALAAAGIITLFV